MRTWLCGRQGPEHETNCNRLIEIVPVKGRADVNLAGTEEGRGEYGFENHLGMSTGRTFD